MKCLKFQDVYIQKYFYNFKHKLLRMETSLWKTVFTFITISLCKSPPPWFDLTGCSKCTAESFSTVSCRWFPKTCFIFLRPFTTTWRRNRTCCFPNPFYYCLLVTSCCLGSNNGHGLFSFGWPRTEIERVIFKIYYITAYWLYHAGMMPLGSNIGNGLLFFGWPRTEIERVIFQIYFITTCLLVTFWNDAIMKQHRQWAVFVRVTTHRNRTFYFSNLFRCSLLVTSCWYDPIRKQHRPWAAFVRETAHRIERVTFQIYFITAYWLHITVWWHDIRKQHRLWAVFVRVTTHRNRTCYFSNLFHYCLLVISRYKNSNLFPWSFWIFTTETTIDGDYLFAISRDI